MSLNKFRLGLAAFHFWYHASPDINTELEKAKYSAQKGIRSIDVLVKSEHAGKLHLEYCFNPVLKQYSLERVDFRTGILGLNLYNASSIMTSSQIPHPFDWNVICKGDSIYLSLENSTYGKAQILLKSDSTGNTYVKRAAGFLGRRGIFTYRG